MCQIKILVFKIWTMRWIAIAVFFKARYIFVHSIAQLSTEVNHGPKNYSTPGLPSRWDWKCGDKKMGYYGNIFTPHWLGLWGKERCQINDIAKMQITFRKSSIDCYEFYLLGQAKVFRATCLTQDSIKMARSTSGSSSRRLA